MYNNFKEKYKGKTLKDVVWSAALASTPQEYETEMEKLKELDKDAWSWLVGKHAFFWSRSHFSSYPKCDILLNNLCETFNGYIIEARDKPILTMLERIRCLLMSRMQVKREKNEEVWGPIYPKIQKNP